MPRVTDMGGRPVSGVVPFAVVGIVTENVDPERLGRVKVKYPTLPGEPTSFWLRQVSPNGGAVGGVYALPEIDDEVLVVFLQGNQDNGVVLGQFWNGTNKPPTEAEDGMPGSAKTEIEGAQLSQENFTDGSSTIDANDRRFWRSRAGHLITMDDTSGSETLQIWDGSHTLSLVMDTAKQAIFLANTGGDIHMRTKGDFVVEAAGNIKFRAGENVEGESGQATKHIAGTNIEVESGTDTAFTTGTEFTVDAGTNVSMTAGVNVEVQGVMYSCSMSSMAEVTASGTVTVRGGMVAIN